MTGVRLRIDRIMVEIEDETRVAEVEETLRKAIALLAGRLATLPGAQASDTAARALDLLELGPVDPGWLAGPGAAASLAEELYDRIVGVMP